MVCTQARLGWFENHSIGNKETSMVKQEPKKLTIFGIEVESAELIIQWGILTIYGRSLKTGKYEKMSFEDAYTRWQVEKELKPARSMSYSALKCGASPVPPAFTADSFIREFRAGSRQPHSTPLVKEWAKHSITLSP